MDINHSKPINHLAKLVTEGGSCLQLPEIHKAIKSKDCRIPRIPEYMKYMRDDAVVCIKDIIVIFGYSKGYTAIAFTNAYGLKPISDSKMSTEHRGGRSRRWRMKDVRALVSSILQGV